MDDQVLNAMLEELEAGRGVELCVLTAVEGSSPRKPGACLVARADGTFAGTVGGGSLERLVLKESAGYRAEGASCVRVYTMDGVQSSTGMICGGGATVAHVNFDPSVLPAVRAVADARSRKEDCCLLLDTQTAAPDTALVVAGDGRQTIFPFQLTDYAGSDGSIPLSEAGRGPRSLADLLEDDAFVDAVLSLEDPGVHEGVFILPLDAEGEAYVIGCGHVGAALVPVLRGLGFKVTAYDDRAELLEAADFPADVRRVCAPYAEFSERVALTHRDYVLVSTSTHGSDLAVVRQAMAARPKFLGCLGSKKKTAFITGKLAEDGFSAEDIARLHMPVGIPLGDETPAEIAISIAAQVIMARRGFTPGD